jgi:hypothetical protein
VRVTWGPICSQNLLKSAQERRRNVFLQTVSSRERYSIKSLRIQSPKLAEVVLRYSSFKSGIVDAQPKLQSAGYFLHWHGPSFVYRCISEENRRLLRDEVKELAYCLDVRQHSFNLRTRKFFPEAPDLAIEVISASNTRSEIDSRMRDLFSSGTQLAWFIHPDEQFVEVCHSPSDRKLVGPGGELDGKRAPALARVSLQN